MSLTGMAPDLVEATMSRTMERLPIAMAADIKLLGLVPHHV